MSNPPVSPLGIAVLSLLEERDMHPYEMIQTLRSRKEDQWIKLRTGSLYHQVEKLASSGLAEALGPQQEGNRPPRTTYRLTDEGRRTLLRWVSVNLTQVENPYFAFSLALGEVSTLDPAQAAHLLAARTQTLARAIDEASEGLDLAKAQGAERVWLLAHEHQLALLRAERDFVTSLVHDIETKDLPWPKNA